MFKKQRAYARIDIPANVKLFDEPAILFARPEDVPPVLLNIKFDQRPILHMLAQLIMGNATFAKTFASRYMPDHCTTSLPTLEKPKAGVKCSPFGSRWVALIYFLEALGADLETVRYWRAGARLERLHAAVSHLCYNPHDLMMNQSLNMFGVWLTISQVAHACSDAANCFERFEMTPSNTGEIPYLSLYTKRVIKKGEELTWSRFASPFGITNNLILREYLEKVTGLKCLCDNCKERRVLHHQTITQLKQQQRQSVKSGRKQSRRKRRKNRSRSKRSKTKNSSSPKGKKELTTPSNKEVTMVVGAHGAYVMEGNGPSQRAVVPIVIEPPRLTFDELRQLLSKPLSLSPGKDGRGNTITLKEVLDARRKAEFCCSLLLDEIKRADTLKDWGKVMEGCELIRKSFDRVPGLMVLLLKHRDITLQLCEAFFGAQFQHSGKMHPSGWWWGALYFRLLTTYCAEVKLRLSGCYAGILSEMGILHYDKDDQSSADRMVGYYSQMCDELEGIFGHDKALAVISKELMRMPMYHTDDGLIPALEGDMPMYPFLVENYKAFCKKRGLDPFDESDDEAVRQAADAAVPQFYPMPIELTARAMQARIKARILRRQYQATLSAAVIAQRAIRNWLVTRRQRKQYLVVINGVRDVQVCVRSKLARATYLKLKRQEEARIARLRPHVVSLQAVIRGHLARSLFLQLRSAIQTIQTMTRAWLARSLLAKLKEEEKRRKEEEQRRHQEEEKQRRKEEEKRRREEEKRRREEERLRREEEKRCRKKEELRRCREEEKRREEEERRCREEEKRREQQHRLRKQEEEEERRFREEERRRLEEEELQLQKREEEEADQEEVEEEEQQQLEQNPEMDYATLQQQYLYAQQQLAIQHHQLALMHHQLELERLMAQQQQQQQQLGYHPPLPPQQEQQEQQDVQDGFVPQPHLAPPNAAQFGGYYHQGVFYPVYQEPGFYYEPEPLYGAYDQQTTENSETE